MNEKDSNPNYKAMYNYVKGLLIKTKYFGSGPHDETYYTLRVFETAKAMIKRIDDEINKEAILTACIFHDSGKTKLDVDEEEHGSVKWKEQWKLHPRLGVEIAKKYLKEEKHSDEFIDLVSYLILYHDDRHINEKTMELKILQDADLIADCGMAGFIRPFLFAGKFGRDIIDTIRYINKETNRADDDSLINLEISKEFAKEKVKIEQDNIMLISKDIDSELL